MVGDFIMSRCLYDSMSGIDISQWPPTEPLTHTKGAGSERSFFHIEISGQVEDINTMN